ncbi:MAG: hypothetical protein ACOYXB_12970 [Bacteroidota bacterium]
MKNRGYLSAAGLLLSLIVAAGAGFNGLYRPWEQAWSTFAQITLVERQESSAVHSGAAVQLKSGFLHHVAFPSVSLFVQDTALINLCSTGHFDRQIRVALRLTSRELPDIQQIRRYLSRSRCSSKDDPYSFSV